MFVGTYERSVDDKGRLSLPASFRSHLGERCYLVTLRGSLGLFSESGFADTIDRLAERVRAGEATQNAMRRFAASVHDVKVDSQGRIVLPAGHRDAAGLTGEVALIGAVNRIEIFRPDRWDDLKDADDDVLDGSWL